MSAPLPIDAQTRADRQAGLQRLPCGCVVNLPGASGGLKVIEACPDVRESLDRYYALTKGLRFGGPSAAAQEAWKVVKAHVALSRRWLATGKQPAEKKLRGLGT